MKPLWWLLPPLAGVLAWAVVWLRLRVTGVGLDQPNHRSLHSVPTPHGGGLGIMFVALLGALILQLDMLWLGCMLMLTVLSFADDWRPLSFVWRLCVHFMAAMIVLNAYPATAPLWSAAVVFMLVWGTNAYNFMDGANGLAGSMAACGFGAYGFAFQLAGMDQMALWCYVISMGALGFLGFNWHPARIFMGDVGSVPLGFLSGALGWYGVYIGAWPKWFPMVVFAPFLGDASVTLFRRVIRGERVWEAHRKHLYQRMVMAGLSHGQMCVRWVLAMLASGVTALGALVWPAAAPVVLVLWGFLLTAIAVNVDRRVGQPK